MAPGLILFAVFYLIAMFVLVVTAFTNWRLRGLEFIGLDNFAAILGDERFWIATRNSMIFVLAAILIQVPLATLLALILARAVRGWRTIRLALFLPGMMSSAALALVYVFVFNPRFGLLNGVLGAIGLDSLARDWLFDYNTALWAVIATWVFNTGLYVVLILNGVHSLPTEINEAAQLDGARRLQREWYMTIPLIRPVIATCMLLAMLTALGYFEGVYVMTSGGPADQTLTLGLYGYLVYSGGDWGLANAIGVLIFTLGAILIVLIRRLGRLEVSDR